MKTIFIKCLALMMALWFVSCQDIIQSDPNYIETIQDTTFEFKRSITYYYQLSSFPMKNNDTIPPMTSIKPTFWSRSFYLENNSATRTFKIEQISMLSGELFDIVLFNLQLPHTLAPLQSTEETSFFVRINTTSLEPGIYEDKVIFNNDANLGFYVKVRVIN